MNGDLLDHVIVGAGLEAGAAGGGFIVGGHDDNAAIAVGGEALDEFDAVDVGKFIVCR